MARVDGTRAEHPINAELGFSTNDHSSTPEEEFKTAYWMQSTVTQSFDDVFQLQRKIASRIDIFDDCKRNDFYEYYTFDEIDDLLGEPNMQAAVFRCYLKPECTRTLAVKRLAKAPLHHLGPEDRARHIDLLRREVDLLRQVENGRASHIRGARYLLGLKDLFEDLNYVYIVTEFCEGGELFDRIEESMESADGMTEAEAATIMKQVIEGIICLHHYDIVHLDLKPANICFRNKDKASSLRIIDFGVSRVIRRLQTDRVYVGTPYYMAPEVIKGEGYNRAADMWSLGIILFAMLFGFPPHYVDPDEIRSGSNLEETVQKYIVAKGFDPTIRKDYGPWFPKDYPVSREARDLIAKLLQVDVHKRITAEEALSHPWITGASSHLKLSWPITLRAAMANFSNYSQFTVSISRLFTSHLNDIEVSRLRDIFNQMDTNNDKRVDYEEFCAALRHADMFPEETLETVFNNIDIDGNKLICFEELLTAYAHERLVAVDERLFQAFTQLDKNNSGSINAQDLRDALSKLAPNDFLFKSEIGHQHGITITDVDEEDRKQEMQQEKRESIIATCIRQASRAVLDVDQDENGEIDYEEFLRALHPSFNDKPKPAGFSPHMLQRPSLKSLFVTGRGGVAETSLVSLADFKMTSIGSSYCSTEELVPLSCRSTGFPAISMSVDDDYHCDGIL